MVDLKGLLKSVLGELRAREEAAGVVGEHLDAIVTGQQRLGQRTDLIEPGEVSDVVFGPGPLGDGLSLLR